MPETISLKTKNQTELIDITKEIQGIVSKEKIENGSIHIFVPHTTAGITINEHADPSVQEDIINKLNKLIPFSDNYQHSEGNSAAHIKSSLVGISQMVAIENGKLVLGTWQGVFFCEFDGPRSRKVNVSILRNS